LLLLLLFLLLLRLCKYIKTTGVWDCYVSFGHTGMWDCYEVHYGRACLWVFLWSPFRTCWNARLLQCFFRTCRYMRLLWTYRLVIMTVSFSDMAFCETVISLLDMVLRESVLLSISDMCVCISRLNASRCRWCCIIWLCTCKCFLQLCNRVSVLLHCTIACYNTYTSTTLAHHVVSLFGLVYGLAWSCLRNRSSEIPTDD